MDPARDRVEVDGRPVALPQLVYLAAHKPVGYLSSAQDERGRPSVLRLAPPIPGLHPVGRLDVDTTGLLLLTNDGDFTYLVTHPRHELEKVYRATVACRPTAAALQRLRTGVELEDGMTAPARARLVSAGEPAVLELAIHEGRKRQVRRMLQAVGYPVLALRRVAVGPVRLGRLAPGQVRPLTPSELAAMRAQAGGVEWGGSGKDSGDG